MFDDVTFKTTHTAFGEYAVHWQLIRNHIWLFPGPSTGIGLGIGGLEVDNRITTSRNACAIKVEGPENQSAIIVDNSFPVGSSPAIVLNSFATDATLIANNRISGSGRFGICVASPKRVQRGAHTISGNRMSGFSSDVFIEASLHSGTIIATH